jgi:REP element-mobilizing transposase RayT
MPEPRKYFVNKNIVFVTSRTEEGLPFVPSHVMNFLIWSILARAKQLYEVRVCHFLFMANHFHMMLVVENPEHVPTFVGYVKAEMSHAVNQLLGRQKKTIWAEGYDSPTMLGLEDVLKYIRYIYLNPAKAGLVHTISDYPGVSSWQMFNTGRTKRLCKHLQRAKIMLLPHAALTVNEQKSIVARYENKSEAQYEFELEPYAWVACFPGISVEKAQRLTKHAIAELLTEEQELKKERLERHSDVIGSTVLRRQSMIKEYVPKKFTRKMICLSSDVERRIRFIKNYKALCDKARKVYESWKRGDLIPKIPPGLFAPRMPTLVCLVGVT